MKRILLGIVVVLLAGLAWLALFPVGQRPDRSFDATVRRPAYAGHHPKVLVDEGHYNAHTAAGLYSPFAKLLENDGFDVRRHRGRFTPGALHGATVLVIVNAAGGSNPKLFGFNLVFLRKGQRDAPAFSDAENAVVREWVRGGGSLLLIADHAPFGAAAAAMGEAFGVEMHHGFTEVSHQYPGQPEPGELEFTQRNGLLGVHPILDGRSSDEHIGRVRTFTGQSLDAQGAAILLRLPPTAVEQIPNRPEPATAGNAQGVALDYGRGRVVVLGEAAMLTAQTVEGHRFGMSMEGLDNRQFALNVMHWLSHAI